MVTTLSRLTTHAPSRPFLTPTGTSTGTMSDGDAAAQEPVLGTVEEALTLSDPDPYAANTSERPARVGLRPNLQATVADGTLRVTLPPVSWTAVSLR